LCRVVCSGGGRGVDSGVFESVARAFEGQDFSVVDDAVDHGRGDDLVAEHVAPAGEWQVRGQDQ
jgi:hypothetical protein